VKLLAVTSEPISARHLRAAIGAQRTEDVEVMVLAPALHSSALRFWLSDADEAIASAEHVERQSVKALAEEGVTVSGSDVGESDIGTALRDALTSFPADRVVLFTHPAESSRYREDVDAHALAAELGVAVDHIELDSGRA